MKPLLSCLFFNSECLQQSTSATNAVETYIGAVTSGFGALELPAVFLNAIFVYSLTRLGGIPIPASRSRAVWWALYVLLLLFQYGVVFLSWFQYVRAYFVLRSMPSVSGCMCVQLAPLVSHLVAHKASGLPHSIITCFNRLHA